MIHDIAATVRRSLQPGQYAHIVPEGHKLAVEIGPKPEPPEPRWKVGDKCDPMDPPPIGTWVHRSDDDSYKDELGNEPARLVDIVVRGEYHWVTIGTWKHAWIAQPPPGERQPWEVE